MIKKQQKKKKMTFEKIEKNSINKNTESRIKKVFMSCLFIFMTFYGFYNARGMITGPTIDLHSPLSENMETSDKLIKIRGEAKNMSFLSLNERPILVDTDGIFEEKLLLSPGSNIIELKAKDRFKNEVKKIIKVYYVDKNQDNYKEEI